MKTLSNYIFIHDQEIILDFLEKKRFKDLENFIWVFLGSKPCDMVKELSNIIICRELPINIEQYPKLTSFTGWYALYKNGFIKTDYVNLFEYDINYIPDFIDINKEMLKKDFDFIGYFPMSVSDIVYVKQTQYTDLLLNSIKEKTNFNMSEYINNLILEKPNSLWSSSSNSTWKSEKLFEYIEWFINFVDDIKNSQYCGHMHERSLSFYYLKNNLSVYLTKGLMTHVQLNSHGTSPLPPERAKHLYNLLK